MSVDNSHLNGGGNPGFGMMDRMIAGIKDRTKSSKEKASRLEEFQQHAAWQSNENQLTRDHQVNMLHEGVKASNAVNNATVATHGLSVGADGSVSHTTTTRAPKATRAAAAKKATAGAVANRAKATSRVPQDTRPAIPLSAPDTEVRPGVDAKPEPKARSPRAKKAVAPNAVDTPFTPGPLPEGPVAKPKKPRKTATPKPTL